MGGALSASVQFFPPRPTWGVNDVPNLTGKVILVTGAFLEGAHVLALNSVGGNAGVGKETVKARWTLYPAPRGLIGTSATPSAQRDGLLQGT
jgi:hypothetical protein